MLGPLQSPPGDGVGDDDDDDDGDDVDATDDDDSFFISTSFISHKDSLLRRADNVLATEAERYLELDFRLDCLIVKSTQRRCQFCFDRTCVISWFAYIYWINCSCVFLTDFVLFFSIRRSNVHLVSLSCFHWLGGIFPRPPPLKCRHCIERERW